MCKFHDIKAKKISTETINCIINYVEILNSININYFKLVSLDCIDNINELKRIYLDICVQTNMIIQTHIDRKINDITDLSRIKLSTENQGINKYKVDFDYLQYDIEIIFEKNKKLLNNMKIVRNKIEHDLDAISLNELYSGGGICGIKLKIDNNIISIDSKDIEKLIISLNDLFYKMISDIDNYISKNDKKNYHHPFYNNLRRYRFDKYNDIIKSNLLYDVSNFINNMK